MTTAKPPRIFFGWKVVAAAFAVTFFSAGIDLYGPPVFLQALHAKHGWPIALISIAITTHFLVSAMTVAWLADAYSRFGIAAVTRAGVLATALGGLWWAVAVSPWQLFGAAILTGAGWATASAAALNVIVSPWFERRRPAALGHALNGMSVAGILFVPLWVMLIDRVGFAVAAAMVGATTLIVTWPLAGRYLRPTPESKGLAADGDPVPVTTGAPPALRPPAARRDIFGDRRFATLSIAFALGMFAQIGLLSHLLARLVPVFGDDGAAAVVSLATACAVAGRSLLAAFLATADRRAVAAGNFLMQAGGVALLAFGSDGMLLLSGAVLFGLGIGNLLLLPPLIAQAEFGRADVARVVSLVIAVNQATFAFGPACLGALRELSGSYAMAFCVAAIIQLLAAIVILLGRGSPLLRGGR